MDATKATRPNRFESWRKSRRASLLGADATTKMTRRNSTNTTATTYHTERAQQSRVSKRASLSSLLGTNATTKMTRRNSTNSTNNNNNNNNTTATAHHTERAQQYRLRARRLEEQGQFQKAIQWNLKTLKHLDSSAGPEVVACLESLVRELVEVGRLNEAKTYQARLVLYNYQL